MFELGDVSLVSNSEFVRFVSVVWDMIYVKADGMIGRLAPTPFAEIVRTPAVKNRVGDSTGCFKVYDFFFV